VAWEKVLRPLDLGGLGIPNLEVMAWPLQIRWQRFKTRADRPWTDLELPLHPNSIALFTIAVTTEVGNGNNTLFWTDHSVAQLKILRQQSLHVSLQEYARTGRWLRLSTMGNGPGRSKEACLGLVLENSYSYGTAS